MCPWCRCGAWGKPKGKKMYNSFLKSLGKRTLNDLAKLPVHEWENFLRNATYPRKNKEYHYKESTIANKLRVMNIISLQDSVPDGLLDVFKDSLHVPMLIRKQAGETYQELRPMAVLPPMKISKSKQKKQK